LEIEDDGMGFDVEAVNKSYDKRGSWNGQLARTFGAGEWLAHIDSAPGKGTRIQVYLPLTEEAADRCTREEMR